MFTRTFGNLFNRFSFSSMGSFQKVTHVIFDLDGLILDSEGLYKKAIGKVIETYGKQYTDEVRLAVLGTIELDTARIIVERLNLPVKVEEFARLCKEEQRKVLGDVTLMPGAERLLQHFTNNKVPLAVATSSGEQSIKLKFTKHQSLKSYFSHIVSGTSDPDVSKGKPAPDIFLVAAKRFPDNPKPEQCLVFEDAPNGVKAARAAGMQVVMVPDDVIPDSMKLEATQVLKSLNEFKPELFGLPPFPPSG